MPSKAEPDTITGQPGQTFSGNGMVESILNAAMGYLGTMYDWGGSGQNGQGVDCSGLIYAAFNAGGFPIARYRAVDFGHMGQAVSTKDARPGDIVYFDNPGTDTDHVGIYLGDGKYIDAPDQGQQVRIDSISNRAPTSIRRLLPDTAWNGMPQNSGGIYYRDPTAGIMHGNPDQQVQPTDLSDLPAYGIVMNPITQSQQQLPSAAEAEKARVSAKAQDDEILQEAESKQKQMDDDAKEKHQADIGEASTVGNLAGTADDSNVDVSNTDIGLANRTAQRPF
jgi:NlpC/P60 family protein